MATPRRRSSRIRSDATPSRFHATPMTKLSSLLERDESPTNGPTMNIDTIVSSPIPPPNTATPQRPFNAMPLGIRTPQTASRLYPSLEEMHPSKAHPSTNKASPSRLHFGNIDSQINLTPSKATITAVGQRTPLKSRASLPQHMTSPSFDFSFERPESDLSLEARKIMDSVREEAAKIKAQMLEERSKQDHKDGETNQLYGVGGRKINKPKGKSGRYSDVHKQEFKKMESIAGHVSTWKNKFQENTSSLKRSPSMAGLDQPQKPLQRTKSFKSFGFNEPRERLEDTSPGKRAKQNYTDDTSAARPVSRDTNPSAQTTPAKVRAHSSLPSAVTTPTKASLARSASVKNMKTSMIPSLSRSASTKTPKSPAMPKTEGSIKYLSSLSRFGSMKSILHRPQPRFSNDPTKVAAGTHLPLPQGKMEFETGLPSLPDTPLAGLHRSPTPKRVGFALTPSGNSRQNFTADLSSPSKIPAQCSQSQPEVSTSPPINTDRVTYPLLANSPNITTRAKLPKSSAPGDFTFRAGKTLDFSPSQETNVTSPGSTIRHVRPSGVPTHVPSFDCLPAIPHGMPNKKRSRPDPDTEAEDDENVDPMETDDVGDDQPWAKKQRVGTSSDKVLGPQSPTKRRLGGASGSRIPKFGGTKEKGRKGLSLGRLNMLARPKERH